MRYYRIDITDATGKLARSYSSLYTGTGGAQLADPGALDIELDISTVGFDALQGSPYVRVWGIPLTDLGPAQDLNGKSIAVYGGMSKGLPLANPLQAGLLAEGVILQAFGNWQNTDMTLDIVMRPGSLAADAPANLSGTWRAGTPMATVITQTLTQAFPTYKPPIVDISPRLVLNNDEPFFYGNLANFAQYVRNLSVMLVGIGGSSYTGVKIVVKQNQFRVFDGTSPQSPATIGFQDLIGQPTWIQPGTIAWACVMRADLSVGDYVKLPQTVVTTTAASLSQVRQQVQFKDTYQVIMVRHVGRFRQPSGDAWVTSYYGNPAVQTDG